ncbi:MAG: hypothetical protein NTY53_21420, partial [Kiritimatiellaeota bacterium]|nr:hypothetical protein [Kiritimatiellota bacterium]
MSSKRGHLDGRWGAWFTAGVLSLASAVASDHSTAWLTRAWQTDDGLPNNDVTAIAQGTDGAMFFATRSGLARFDGLRLQNIASGEDKASLRGVNGLCVGHDGTLWLISGGRLVALRANQPPRSFPFSAIPADPRVNTMFEHPQGMLWVCFEEHPVLRIDIAATDAAGRVTTPPLDGAGRMPALAKDSAKHIWVAGSGALLRWTGEKLEPIATLPQEKVSLCAARAGGLWLGIGRQLLRHTVTGCVGVARRPAGPPGNRASVLLEDRQGRVWFGTFGDGLHVWDGIQFSRVDLPSRDIWCLQEDREGNLWAGTGGGGVCRIRPRVLAMLEEPDAPAALTPRSLCADSQGDIWVALQTGKLCRRQAGNWQQLEDQRDWPAAFATCVAAEKIPLPPARGHGRIRALFVAHNGELWIGRGHVLLHGQPGHWQELLDTKRQELQEIQTITHDSKGQIWAGTRSGVLLLATPTNLVRRTPPELAGCGSIRTLLGTSDDALWIGASGGLARLKDGQCRLLTTAHGLRHNVVSQLILGPHDRLWAAGDRGIFFTALNELNAVAEGRAATFQCNALGSGEGAPGLQANSGYAPNTLLSPAGRIWFATRSGIAIADPTFCGNNTIPPPVAIAEMFVDDLAIALPQTQPARIGPGATELRFLLSAMSYVAPENVRLRHRLDGADTK